MRDEGISLAAPSKPHDTKGMKSLWPVPVALLLPILGACSGNDGNVGGSGSTGSLSTSSTSSTMPTSSSTGTSTGTGGNGSGYTPPVVPAACATPVVTPAATWDAPANQHFGAVEIAWDGARGAVAYAESTTPSSWDVKVQMLKADGSVDGAPVKLLAAGGSPLPVVALAMRPSALVACVEHSPANQLACAAYGGSGTPTPGFTGPGTGPSLVMGAAGFGLLYGAGIELHSQLLTDAGLASGADHVVATAQNAGFPNPVSTSNDDGYLALSVPWGSIMWRFDDQFQELEGKTIPGWLNRPSRIAGLGTTVGTVSADASQVSFRHAGSSGMVSASVKIDDVGASPVYSQVDVTRGKASFAAVWSAFEGHVGYRAIDASGSPLGTPQNVMDTAWDDNPVRIVGVADGFLVASATGSALTTIKIAHLACP